MLACRGRSVASRTARPLPSAHQDSARPRIVLFRPNRAICGGRWSNPTAHRGVEAVTRGLPTTPRLPDNVEWPAAAPSAAGTHSPKLPKAPELRVTQRRRCRRARARSIFRSAKRGQERTSRTTFTIVPTWLRSMRSRSHLRANTQGLPRSGDAPKSNRTAARRAERLDEPNQCRGARDRRRERRSATHPSRTRSMN